MITLAPLVPLVAAIGIRVLMGLRSDVAQPTRPDVAAAERDETLVFKYPKGSVRAVLVCAVLAPAMLLSLPDSWVLDARSSFNDIALAIGVFGLVAWSYLYRYRIVVSQQTLAYGAFKTAHIDLQTVTRVKYFWVGNGICLKLFAGHKRIGIFEGGIEGFDGFAKAVRARLPEGVTAETVGTASFE